MKTLLIGFYGWGVLLQPFLLGIPKKIAVFTLTFVLLGFNRFCGLLIELTTNSIKENYKKS